MPNSPDNETGEADGPQGGHVIGEWFGDETPIKLHHNEQFGDDDGNGQPRLRTKLLTMPANTTTYMLSASAIEVPVNTVSATDAIFTARHQDF